MRPARSSPKRPTGASRPRRPTASLSLTSGAIVHGMVLGAACLITFEATTHLLRGVHSVAASDDLLGGMWAVLATVFVFRATSAQSLTAAISRLAATAVSLLLCLIYLLIAPSHPVGWAALIALGTIAVTAIGRADDAVTTGITIAVVMVVAQLEPHNAWEQPILRFVDTLVGVAVGLAAAWLVLRMTGPSARGRRRRGADRGRPS